MRAEPCGDFPRTLSALRKEKGVSQRTAAALFGCTVDDLYGGG